MTRHARREPPMPTGMKVFALIIGSLVVAMGSLTLGGLGSDEPAKPEKAVDPSTTATTVKKQTEVPLPKNVEPSPTLSTFYVNCQAAKDVGALPLVRGEAGYRQDLDMDGDGTACEGV